LENIGAIIIDEEHDSSYKQDSSPRYLTHSVAEFRATQDQAVVILGSATPSIESYYYAKNRPNWSLFTLKNRVNDSPMPPVTLIENSMGISPELLAKLKERLPLKGILLQNDPDVRFIEGRRQDVEGVFCNSKSIVLINRRGYSPYVSCASCQHVLSCRECKLGLTYHSDRKLRCHRCHLTYALTHQCPKCKKTRLDFSGIGIQRIESDLKKWMPDASIIRMDKDTAPNEKKASEILEKFRDDGDILVGTQMVAKGHHIEEVTLVGIVGIDTTLNLPDFRAPERTFQLITQVAGRAGRGVKRGEVVIQTLNPSHYAIQCATTHDYLTFYTEEIRYRHQLHYPPFSHLINIIVSGENPIAIRATCATLYQHLKTHLDTDLIQCTAPNPCPIEKVRTLYRFHILIKSPLDKMEEVKAVIATKPSAPKEVRILVDFDPHSLF